MNMYSVIVLWFPVLILFSIRHSIFSQFYYFTSNHSSTQIAQVLFLSQLFSFTLLLFFVKKKPLSSFTSRVLILIRCLFCSSFVFCEKVLLSNLSSASASKAALNVCLTLISQAHIENYYMLNFVYVARWRWIIVNAYVFMRPFACFLSCIVYYSNCMLHRGNISMEKWKTIASINGWSNFMYLFVRVWDHEQQLHRIFPSPV